MLAADQKALNKALIIAAANCRPEDVQAAINAGAYINATFKKRRTPLMYAVLYCPKSSDEARDLAQRQQRTLDILLDTPGIQVNLQDVTSTDEIINSSSGGNTALMLAVRHGYFACVQRLMKVPYGSSAPRGVIPDWSEAPIKVPTINLQCRNFEHYNAAMLAIIHSEYDLFRLFMKKELYTLDDIQKAFIVFVGNPYPQEYAIMDEVMKYPGFDINYKAEHGSTALLRSMMGDYNCETIVRLLQHPQIDVNYAYLHGETPIMRMAGFDEPLIVRLLLTFPQLNVLQPNKRGRMLWDWMKDHRRYEERPSRPYQMVRQIIKERVQSSREVRALTEINLFSPRPYLPLELQKHIGRYLLKRPTFQEVLDKYGNETREKIFLNRDPHEVDYEVIDTDSDSDLSL